QGRLDERLKSLYGPLKNLKLVPYVPWITLIDFIKKTLNLFLVFKGALGRIHVCLYTFGPVPGVVCILDQLALAFGKGMN
ncbi:hypothetical protein, partial [Staphylococcus epidermidis]|uniref:hypothetical protein n=1 Tax=Staphylococcus epidermidis TaxID=1282 RepID=UPI001C92D899